MSTNYVKAHFSAQVVLSSVFDATKAEEHLREAQQRLHGWSFHVAVQYASGKRFLAELERVDNLETRTSWALAHVIAKEASSSNRWSGAGRPTDADLERYRQLAAALAASTGC